MSIGWKSAETYITGLGQTAMTRESGVSEYQLALTAAQAAVADAQLSLSDVDGLVTFSADSTEPFYLAQGLGISELSFASKSSYGGGGAGEAFVLAAMAVASGNANCVVVYRSINGRSTTRYGQPMSAEQVREMLPFTSDYGVMTPGHRFSLAVHRVMHDLGITNEGLAPLCVQQRKYAAINPRAIFYNKPITLDDYQNSPWVSQPVLRLLDCCLETDGAAAFVVTNKDLAKRTRHQPVHIRAGATGTTAGPVEIPGDGLFNKPASALPEVRVVAEQLWRLSGLSAGDMDAAILYDHFSPFVPLQLEAYGFCKEAQSLDFIRQGGTAIDGSLPVNTNGGQLGEGYIHGMNGVAEAIRQLRGDAVTQVNNANNILVSGGPGLPSSGLILSTG